MMKKWLILACTVIAAVLLYFYGLYHSSKVAGNFPVPVSAKLSESSDEKAYEEYSWTLASEENGLPSAYLLAINLWGWKKVDQMGALTTYEKNGEKIDVISQTDYLFIAKSE
ncbi:hypothetical protein RFW18_03450 [Metabacillus idriensis]|uniref:hypothetical protein n=1 Tax=Metabacillus idriensis TaxID=324768 RepID=UPI002813342A|nr:hypothetical protein [Metabacillus idriensis]MDR0136787.1 hypothetical protein [Metabacillus idriensis]